MTNILFDRQQLYSRNLRQYWFTVYLALDHMVLL